MLFFTLMKTYPDLGIIVGVRYLGKNPSKELHVWETQIKDVEPLPTKYYRSVVASKWTEHHVADDIAAYYKHFFIDNKREAI